VGFGGGLPHADRAIPPAADIEIPRRSRRPTACGIRSVTATPFFGDQPARNTYNAIVAFSSMVTVAGSA
jgi:hypothetical protein